MHVPGTPWLHHNSYSEQLLQMPVSVQPGSPCASHGVAYPPPIDPQSHPLIGAVHAAVMLQPSSEKTTQDCEPSAKATSLHPSLQRAIQSAGVLAWTVWLEPPRHLPAPTASHSVTISLSAASSARPHPGERRRVVQSEAVFGPGWSNRFQWHRGCPGHGEVDKGGGGGGGAAGAAAGGGEGEGRRRRTGRPVRPTGLDLQATALVAQTHLRGSLAHRNHLCTREVRDVSSLRSPSFHGPRGRTVRAGLADWSGSGAALERLWRLGPAPRTAARASQPLAVRPRRRPCFGTA